LTEKIELIEEIQRISPFSQILITTYKYSQPFFEKHIFPHFKDKTLPLILVDYKEYQNNALEFGNSKLSGRKYFIESINHKKKKIFHPKLFLGVNKNEVLILIGSNNLTYEGYKKNAELVVPLIIDIKSGKNLELINDTLDFLNEIQEIIGDQYKEYLLQIIDKLKKYSKVNIEHKKRNSWILHNIKDPFLKQIQNIIKEKIEEIDVISPFFSQDKNFYQNILDFCPKINIIIQQGTSNLPIYILKHFKQINYNQLIVGDESERFLHSKLLLIKTEKKRYVFCTSANFTRHALLSNDNIELGILIQANISLNDLIRPIGRIECINLDDIKTSVLKIDDDSKGTDFTIIEAYREENHLIFKVSEDLDSITGEIILFLNDQEKHFEFEKNGNILKFKVDSEAEEILSKSLVAKIIVKDKSAERVSNYRVIKNQQLFPERFDFLNSYNINDANYFHKILEKLVKLPNPSDYIPVLDLLVEQDIFLLTKKEAEILKLKNKISRTQQNKQRLKLSTLIEKIQKKHEKRIENAIKYKETRFATKDINSFIFTNKAIIWGVLKDINYPIEELRQIRANIKEFFGKYLKILSQNNKLELVANSKLKYHLLILTFIIDKLQSNSEKFKPDPRLGFNSVKQVFEQTTLSQLYQLCAYEGNSFKDYEIVRLVEEYAQIFNEILKINPKYIIDRINIIAKKLANQKKLEFQKLILDEN